MNVVVLMAGEGKRFQTGTYSEPKPFIKTKDGKRIYQKCLSVFGELLENKQTNLAFALRADHGEYFSEIKSEYPESRLAVFDKTTRGNLETALATVRKTSLLAGEPLLVLDSDNFGDYGGEFVRFVDGIAGDAAAITVFEPYDDSTKWLFLKPTDCLWNKNTVATKISEKDPNGLKQKMYPAIGTFWFSSTRLFTELGEEILAKHKGIGEVYMSSSFVKLQKQYFCPVYMMKVNRFVPLGTPEDFERFNKQC